MVLPLEPREFGRRRGFASARVGVAPSVMRLVAICAGLAVLLFAGTASAADNSDLFDDEVVDEEPPAPVEEKPKPRAAPKQQPQQWSGVGSGGPTNSGGAGRGGADRGTGDGGARYHGGSEGMSRYVVSRYVRSRYVMSRYVMSRHVVWNYHENKVKSSKNTLKQVSKQLQHSLKRV